MANVSANAIGPVIDLVFVKLYHAYGDLVNTAPNPDLGGVLFHAFVSSDFALRIEAELTHKAWEDVKTIIESFLNPSTGNGEDLEGLIDALREQLLDEQEDALQGPQVKMTNDPYQNLIADMVFKFGPQRRGIFGEAIAKAKESQAK